MQIIYADNAATTRLSPTALKEMLPYFEEEYSNPSQPYFFSKISKRALKQAREKIARAINANPDEIFFTSGGSESDNWAIKCFGLNGDIKTIITSNIEHHAVLNACDSLKNNCDIKYLSVNSNGIVDPNDLESIMSMKKDVCASCESTLVSVMLANNEIGSIQRIKELAKIAHGFGAVFHTDAVQAVGHIAIDVRDLGIDMLSASAHKFNGPKGIGFLYVRKGTILQRMIDGGSQEFGYRAGTENVASIVGMSVALDENVSLLEKNIKYIKSLENAFFDELNKFKLDYIRNGDEVHLPGLISLSFKGKNGESILHRMDLLKCCISTGSACDSVNNQVSHVIKAIGVPVDYAEGTIRISFGKYNTIDEAVRLAQLLNKVIIDNFGD